MENSIGYHLCPSHVAKEKGIYRINPDQAGVRQGRGGGQTLQTQEVTAKETSKAPESFESRMSVLLSSGSTQWGRRRGNSFH